MKLFKPAMGMVFSVLCIAGLSRPAFASLVVWGNGAGHGTNHLQAFDLETGDKLRDFNGPNPDARGFFGGDAGRGIAVAGNTVYYTSSGSGKVFMADANSFADLGFAFDTGLTGLRSIAFDGSTFWIRDDFSNQLRRYTAGGTLLSILPDFTSSFDVYGDRILARDATGFALYDLGGLALEHLFDYGFDEPSQRGVAYDGTHIAVHTTLNHIRTYDLTGTLLFDTELADQPIVGDDRFYVDLSFVKDVPEAVPEPGSLILLGLGLIPVMIRFRKKRAIG